MKFWLLHIGEDLPVDGPSRPYRYTYLAEALCQAGHEVLRWAPTFRHNTKEYRFSADERVRQSGNYEIQFVHATGYRRNIGIERLRSYRVLGRRFCDLASREAPPDLILAAIPSLEWAEAAVEFGRQHSIPVVVDVRDRWPDVFANAFPAVCRPLAQIALRPFYRRARRACRDAAALTAVSKSYLSWALNLAGRSQEVRDRVVPLAFQPEPLSAASLQDKIALLGDQGIDPNRPICLFVGLFERSYDLETVVAAARQMECESHGNLQFVLCGDGSKMRTLRRKAAGLRNLHLIGWVDAAMLEAVASISTIGLCAYTADAMQSLPNKPFEYLARGLAVVSSLPGEMAEMLRRHQCGLTYRAGDSGALVDCLRRLLSDPKRLKAMRSQAYQTWLHNFQSREVYSAFASHLASLASDARWGSLPDAPSLQVA